MPHRAVGDIPEYLVADLQGLQSCCLDIIDLPRDTPEPQATRRDTHAVHVFKNVVESNDYPCRRFLDNHSHKYSLGSLNMRVPASPAKMHQDLFINSTTSEDLND